MCPSAPEVSFFSLLLFFLGYEDVSIIQDQNIYNSINLIFYHSKISQRQKVGAFETPSLGEKHSHLAADAADASNGGGRSSNLRFDHLPAHRGVEPLIFSPE